MSYTRLDKDTRGDTSKDHTMRIDVMKATVPSSSALDSAYTGVVDALDQIMDRQDDISGGMDIPGYVARKYTTDKALDCSNPRDSARTWCNNNGFNDGHHTWVTNCGEAVSDSSGAWEGRTQSVVSTDWYGSSYYLSVMAIHESLHAFINQSCNYTPSNDHVLGWDQPKDLGDFCTPMAASYEDDPENYEAKGDCGRDVTTDGVTRDMTTCTIEALRYSREHAYVTF